jgi:hypothetical protein
MAKDTYIKKEVYPYPSRFGSHLNMMIKDNSDGTVVCEDEFGEYTTNKRSLDNGLADVARFNSRRVKII